MTSLNNTLRVGKVMWYVKIRNQTRCWVSKARASSQTLNQVLQYHSWLKIYYVPQMCIHMGTKNKERKGKQARHQTQIIKSWPQTKFRSLFAGHFKLPSENDNHILHTGCNFPDWSSEIRFLGLKIMNFRLTAITYQKGLPSESFTFFEFFSRS